MDARLAEHVEVVRQSPEIQAIDDPPLFWRPGRLLVWGGADSGQHARIVRQRKGRILFRIGAVTPERFE
jgi:hypothetical protein